MKKRILLLVTATVLTMSMAACGKGGDDVANNTEINTENNVEAGTESGSAEMTAVEVLENVWATYGEEEKFPAMGGDMENMVDGAPGAYSMEVKENLTFDFQLPAEAIDLVDETAALRHGMNLNTFTGAAFHLADAANAETFANVAKEGVMNAQWMCGFPEKLVIATVHEEFVVFAYGNGEIVENFKNKVTTVYGEAAVVLVEENL